MKVHVPWKMTLLALSISTLAACGGGGGGGGGDDRPQQGNTINQENADEIARLAATGGSAGKNSDSPNAADQNRSRNATAVVRAPGDDENEGDDENDDFDDNGSSIDDLKSYYDQLIGQTYKETDSCSLKGTSSIDITFVEPETDEIFRMDGNLSFNKCQEEDSDYIYTGSVEMVYAEKGDTALITLVGNYTQRHTSGVVIEATNYQESSTETDYSYSATYSYDATGTPFGDKKVRISTTTPVVTNEGQQFPASGGIRVQAEDGSFLTMTVSDDGLGVNMSVNGGQEEFKSWSQLDSADLSHFGSPEDDGEDDGSDDDDLPDDETTDDDDIIDDPSDGTDDNEGDDSDGDDEGDDDGFDDDFGGDEDDDSEEDEDDFDDSQD